MSNSKWSILKVICLCSVLRADVTDSELADHLHPVRHWLYRSSLKYGTIWRGVKDGELFNENDSPFFAKLRAGCRGYLGGSLDSEKLRLWPSTSIWEQRKLSPLSRKRSVTHSALATKTHLSWHLSRGQLSLQAVRAWLKLEEVRLGWWWADAQLDAKKERWEGIRPANQGGEKEQPRWQPKEVIRKIHLAKLVPYQWQALLGNCALKPRCYSQGSLCLCLFTCSVGLLPDVPAYDLCRWHR